MLEARETLQPAFTFADVIRDPSFSPGRFYVGPGVIDLGIHQEAAEELTKFTIADPNHREAGRVFYVEKDGRVMADLRFFVGDENNLLYLLHLGINQALQGSNAPRHERQQRLVGSLAHTHSRDSIFTPIDLETLLLDDLASKAASSALLLTPKRKLLALRGKNTPQFQKPLLHMERLDNTVRAESANRIISEANGYQDETSLIDDINKEVFRNFAKEFDLQVFEGGVWDRYLRRVPADQIARRDWSAPNRKLTSQ